MSERPAVALTLFRHVYELCQEILETFTKIEPGLRPEPLIDTVVGVQLDIAGRIEQLERDQK